MIDNQPLPASEIRLQENIQQCQWIEMNVSIQNGAENMISAG